MKGLILVGLIFLIAGCVEDVEKSLPETELSKVAIEESFDSCYKPEKLWCCILDEFVITSEIMGCYVNKSIEKNDITMCDKMAKSYDRYPMYELSKDVETCKRLFNEKRK